MTDGLQPQPPATAAEARALLDTRIADKSWGAALLAGDVATNAEYRALRAKADNPDPADQVAVALSGNIGEMPDSTVKMLAETAASLREIGISEPVIEQALRGHEVSEQELKLVEG